MSEEVDETAADTDPADKDWQAEAEKWKAHARKHEDQAKANSAAAKRLAEIEAANKTAEEKAAEARATAERERDDARLALLRRDVAEDAGLPRTWADRLRGTTKEELEADAKQLAKDLEPAAKPTTARPVPDLKSAALPASGTTPSTSGQVDDWIRRQARRG